MVDLLSNLRGGTLPERDLEVLERMRRASARLTRMINDLLDASRIEARRLSLDRRIIDLSALVDRVVEGLTMTTASQRIVVTAEPHLEAFCDADRIEQVLENLVTNAVKYGELGSPIQVEVIDRRDEIEIVVANRGPGIAADQLPGLFARFGRIEETSVARKPGVGLGLYISKGLVEAQGGRIWAESVPGDTTTFHFTVPCRPESRAGAGESRLRRDAARPHH